MRVEQLTPPAQLPVSLDDAKRQIGLLDDHHDLLLIQFVEAAARYVENYTQSRLVTQELRFVGEAFGPIPVYPLQSIDAFVYDNPEGAETAMTEYHLDTSGLWPRIAPESGLWPALAPGKPGSVRITATVGYGGPDDVPADIRMAILLRVKEMYANRGESVPGMGGMVALSPVTIRALLQPYRRVVA
jgi:uncharacterized phiE125 gp8 family phage protein